MKSLTSKAVPPDRRLPNQLHGWLAKSALNLTTHLSTPKIFSLFFFLSKVQVIYFIATFSPPLACSHFASISLSFILFYLFFPCLCTLERKWTRRGREKKSHGGSETREEWMNRMSGVSRGRIRKQRMRDWVDGETSRVRDRRTGLNKQRSGS